MAAYYNEFDPQAAQWLRNLIQAGLIAPGDVDERSIVDVAADDLRGYTQCHFFAGIGVWSYALRRAGWADGRPVWTGSCPCQPFSNAGAQAAFEDPRHLWPHFFRLIGERRPPVVFGEQVAGKIVDPLVDLVQADLEAVDYAFGAVPFPSASVGAPHIRDRVYWVGYTSSPGLDQRIWVPGVPGSPDRADAGQTAQRAGVHSGGVADVRGFGFPGAAGVSEERRCQAGTACDCRDCRLANADSLMGGQGRPINGRGHPGSDAQPGTGSWCDDIIGGLADTDGHGRDKAGQCESQARLHGVERDGGAAAAEPGTGPVNGFWRDVDWLFCRDAKWRPVESGTFPLVDGAAARVVRLRAYGNAINAEQAKIFVEAFLETEERPVLGVPSDLIDLQALI